MLSDEKSDEKIVVSVSVDPSLLAQIDQRAADLDLNRSQYLRKLARVDIDQSRISPTTDSSIEKEKAA